MFMRGVVSEALVFLLQGVTFVKLLCSYKASCLKILYCRTRRDVSNRFRLFSKVSSKFYSHVHVEIETHIVFFCCSVLSVPGDVDVAVAVVGSVSVTVFFL